MMDWERDDLVLNMGNMLAQCERDVQERMLWHLFLIHDEYGARVGQHLGMTAADVKRLTPLTGQVLTEEDEARLQKLGDNGDVIDPNVWGKHTSSVTNYQASAGEVLGSKLTVPAAGEEAGLGKAKEDVVRSVGS
jgi:catalase